MMADIHGDPRDASSMFAAAAPNSGPAPVPFPGALPSEPPPYGVDLGALTDAGYVLHGVTNLGTAESPAAHDLAAGTVDAPYYPGPLAPVNAMGDADAGGRDDVAATVAGSVANATGRWHEFQADTYGQGSVIGDLMHFPPIGEDPGAGVGNTLPTQAFYDPPREYGGTSGPPVYGGNTGNEPPPPGQQGAPQ